MHGLTCSFWANLTPFSLQIPALQAAVAQAYGYGGLGILAVMGVPALEQARQAMLPLARRFAAGLLL